MKRALLIAGGTLGGLGAVMAITPPQLSSTNSLGLTGAGAIGAPAMTDTSTASATPTASSTKAATTKPVATKKATPAATKKATPVASKSATAQATATASASASATPAATPTKTATPVATKTTAPVVTKSTSGTFAGPAIFVNYGTVQVQITVNNGKITDAKALQAPNGRSQRWTDMAVPTLRQQTLSAQSANIQGASGASYTSYGWYKSLQGALAKAGL
jgi:uncharacterized protein with FMN-binding domain